MAVHLADICDPDALAWHIDAGLVVARTDPHSDGELTIYNYTAAAQYSRGAFTHHEVRLARGLIVDRAGRIVARAFPKFANANQHGDGAEFAPLPLHEPAVITEKLDGSLGIVFRHNGRLRVATRGSFDSPQARWAQRWLDTHVDPDALSDIDGSATTLCVEILSPVSRVVCSYPTDELVALAAIDNATGADTTIPDDWPGHIVDTHPVGVPAALAMAGTNPDGSTNREGVVVRFQSGVRVKVKFGDYLRLHAVVVGLNRRRVWQHWAISLLGDTARRDPVSAARAVHLSIDDLHATLDAGDPVTALLDVCPDEALDLVRGELADLDHALAQHHRILTERVADVAHLEQRDVAAALPRDPYLPAVFLRRRGHNPDVALVRLVEPPADPLDPRT